MSQPQEQGERGLTLERGRLIGRPGPDIYLYAFESPGGPLPDPGRRGIFALGAHEFPAQLVDRLGPRLTISLTADKPLGPQVAGLFRPEPPAAPPEPAEAGRRPDLALFLDPAEGWVMSAAEAASRKAPLFDPAHWPRVARGDLPGHLNPHGPTFIWRQAPDRDAAAVVRLVGHFLEHDGRVLVTGQTYADLEPLAELPGAVFTGPASPGTPLHPVSIHTRTIEAREARELELGRLRNGFNDLQSAETGVKARLTNWTDLDDLERRFLELGREVERHRRLGTETRESLASARASWEEASLAVEKSGRGLLGWRKSPNGQARRREEGCRQALDSAEATLATVRREEERLLAEARHLEDRLHQMRRDSMDWIARDRLQEELARLRGEREQTAALLVAVNALPKPRPEDFIMASSLVLAAAGTLAPGGWSGPDFTDIVALVSSPPDHAGRQGLAALAPFARRHLVVLGDFTFWPVWSGRAPGGPEAPAWLNLIAAEEADEVKTFLAEGGLFTGGGRLPAGGPALARLELGTPPGPLPAAMDASSPIENDGGAPRPVRPRAEEAGPGCGLGLRALGDLGPANPVSALTTARAALEFARRLEEPGPAAIVLTASAAQARLVRLMLEDLGAPPGRVFSGEPQDFSHWNPVPLVILEPAFEAPHAGHPWAWPSFGRQKLTWAWSLARDHIWLAGRNGWMRQLPETSPLAALWRLAENPAEAAERPEAPGSPPAPAFWEALDKAKEEVWAIIPTFEPFWWRPLEEHFLAAARRRVPVTILTAPPVREGDREYAGAAIKTLSAYGCSVHLAGGFPGLLALVDGGHLTWGHFVPGARGFHVWSGLKSALIPRAGREIGEILQMKLITEKMGRRGGGLKTCRHCGWPLMLINQEHFLGAGDEQPLKLSCLTDCQGRRGARRLDEREPFAAPPRCGLTPGIPFQRLWRGRQEAWVCPRHPDGPDCPSFRVVPGDPPGGRP